MATLERCPYCHGRDCPGCYDPADDPERELEAPAELADDLDEPDTDSHLTYGRTSDLNRDAWDYLDAAQNQREKRNGR